ncbi:hypothetical protein CK220_06480 [Mesorhizobium sp. WSM3860]|nr:hypothetical protein CK220_06480 [Mesorhizobium sp. WSM3860]
MTGGRPELHPTLELHLCAICPSVRAAPHLPAGILSPHSDGERGALIAAFANCQCCKKSAEIAASPFSRH